MAATKRNAMLRPETAEQLRNQIRATQIVKRLAAFALGENDPQNNKPIEMTPHQVTAALGLLRKSVPDLASIEQHIEDSRERVVSGEPLNDDQWEKRYGDSLATAAGAAKSTH